jgi:hypothetical protein
MINEDIKDTVIDVHKRDLLLPIQRRRGRGPRHVTRNLARLPIPYPDRLSAFHTPNPTT